MRNGLSSLLMMSQCLLIGVSSFANVLVYDPFPLGDGNNNDTYLVDQDLSGTNADVLATEGNYVGVWHWSANWGVVDEGLTYTDENRRQLVTSGGALEKQSGGISYRNFTVRQFSGASKTTTYFSCLVRFNHFGDGVDTRIGLMVNSAGLKQTGYFQVNKNGAATAVMYSTASAPVQLETRVTYLLVGKMEYDVADGGNSTSERVTIWIQPKLDLSDEPSADDTDQFLYRLEATSSSQDYLSNHIGARASESSFVDILIDEYRVGTTWDAVLPATSAVVLYDPVPVGDGVNNETYLQDQNVGGSNSNVLATLGTYTGGWHWASNYGVISEGLEYIDEARHRALLTTGGAFNKLHGNLSYRNYTVRSFAGAQRRDTYFSGLINWSSFGDGVNTVYGLARLDGNIAMTAYLSVDNAGTAKAIMYGTASATTAVLDLNTTYLVVGRLEYDMDSDGSERLTIWLQPNTQRDTGPGLGETAEFLHRFEVTSNADDQLATYIGGRGDEGDGSNKIDFRVDEYAVGWTYKSVVPTTAYYNVTEAWVTSTLPVLDQPLGGRWPVFIWGNPVQYSSSDESYIDNLYTRGLCYTPNIAVDRNADAAGKMTVLENKGYARPMIMQTSGTVTFNTASHQPPAIVDAGDYPCLGFFQDKIPQAYNRTQSFMTDLQNLGMSPSVFLFDWENWCRYVYPIADPSSDATLTDRRGQANLCPRCLLNLTTTDLGTNADYLNAVEAKRGLVLKDGLYGAVRNAFPLAMTGNYWTTSHTASDQSLGNTTYANGWHGSGSDFSMPLIYGNRYDKMKDPVYVGWNAFRYYLQLYSEGSRGAVGTEFQMPWTCRVLSGDAMEDENELKKELFTSTGVLIPLTAWPRDSYRECLRHMMLRGAKTFTIFYPQGNTLATSLGYQKQLSDVLEVLNEMHAYDNVLDNGIVMNMTNLPGDYYTHADAVVWSGVATETRAVIRAVSFTGSTSSVSINVFGRTELVSATPGGLTTVINK